MTNRAKSRLSTKQAVHAIQTDGLEFIEFTSSAPNTLEQALVQLGFTCVADHRHKDVRLYRQNDINFILNAEPHSQASQFAQRHGPSSNALAFRVPNIQQALDCASRLNLEIVESTAGPMELNIPAVRGVGDSLIYLVDRYGSESIYAIDFHFRESVERNPTGCFENIDHVTQNVRKGQLENQVVFYKRVFGFRELQTFDIRGAHTGLASVALVSACGKIKLPVNEPTDSKSQIAEFIETHHGGGVQHIAMHTNDIFEAVTACRERGTQFQSTPSNYYKGLKARHLAQYEDVARLEKHHILIDGSLNDGVLLQIFTQDMIGPVFFEVIQRKGNQGFGEGNFQALFESIERDQVKRGVFDEAV